MIEKITLEATIPYVQYGNVKPTIEVEGDDWDTIRDQAIGRIKEISDRVAPKGAEIVINQVNQGATQPVATMKKLATLKSKLTGATVFYDSATHQYKDKDGYLYTSSSKFHDKFYPDFDKESVLNAICTKYQGVNSFDIADMWKLSSQASTGYGTAIHAALENYDKNRELGDKIKGDNDNKALSKNAFLKKIVEWFQEGKDGEDISAEEFIADEKHKLASRVDRIKWIDREKRIIRIQDYKTDGDIHSKEYQSKDSPFKMVSAKDLKAGVKQNPIAIENTTLGKHWLQLSFSAFILKQAGFTVEGLDLFWLNPNKLIKGENPWETFSHDVVDITKGL